MHGRGLAPVVAVALILGVAAPAFADLQSIPTGSGNQSILGGSSQTIPTGTAQAAGPSVQAQAGASGVALTWTVVPAGSDGSVLGYDIYRGTAAGAEGSTPLNASPIAATTYTDQNVQSGQTYYYTVTAVFADQTQSQPSTEISAQAAAATASGATVTVAMVIGSSSVTVDGMAQQIDVPPTIVNGRTLVPLRFLGNAIGAQVGWNQATRQVTFTTSAHSVLLTIDQPTATVDGQSVSLDVPPTIINSRTLVPIRFVSEHLGGQVGWDQSTMTVTVTFGGSDAAGGGTSPASTGGGTASNLGPNAQATGGNCPALTIGASTVQAAGQGRILLDYNGGAGTIETVDPATGAVTGQTTYPILETARYDPATGNTAGFPYLADKFPRLSPDGTHVSLGLKVVALDGTSTTFTGNTAVFNWTSAEWSPDGRYLAYQGGGGSEMHGQVYVMDTTTGQQCLAVPAAGADYVKWLPGGGLIYSTDNGLYRVSADMAHEVALPVQTGQIFDGNAGKGPSSAGDFDLSPDGTRVTWAQPDASGNPQIWISNLDGTGAKQYTNDSGGDVTPRFSPDGTRIAYVARIGSVPGQLWIMNTDGTGASAQKTAAGGVMVGVLGIEQWHAGGNVDSWPSQ